MSEARPTGERVTLSQGEASARNRRSLWTAAALFGFVALVFLITLVRIGGAAASGS